MKMAKEAVSEATEEVEETTLDAAEQAVREFEFEATDEPDESEGAGAEESEAEEATAEESESDEAEEAPEEELPEKAPEAAEDESDDSLLSPRLLHAGRRAGLSEEDVESLGDQAESVLSRLADGFDTVSTNMAKLGSPRLVAPEQSPEQPAAETPAPAAPAVPAAPADGAFRLDLDEDLVDPDLIEALRPVEEQMNQLRSTMAAFQERDARQEEQRLRQEANAFFAKVDKDFGGIFGEGATVDLAEDSSERKARMDVIRQADIIAAGAATRGFDMSVDEALDRGLSLMSREHQQKAVRRTFTKNAKRRSGQRIARPARRTTERAYKTPEAKAEAALVEAVREKGRSFSEDDG